MSAVARGQVFGSAGAGLHEGSWAANNAVARVGESGELRTAAILNKIAVKSGGPTVLHDVMLPSNSGLKANVDHIVVVGSTVHLIDTKVWKPARYWTWRGVTRRGLKPFPYADKQTMSMARTMLSGMLANSGVHAEFVEPTVVVWPSSSMGVLSVRWLRVPAAQAVTGDSFSAHARKSFRSTRRRSAAADPAIVAALAPFVSTAQSSRERRKTVFSRAAEAWPGAAQSTSAVESLRSHPDATNAPGLMDWAARGDTRS